MQCVYQSLQRLDAPGRATAAGGRLRCSHEYSATGFRQRRLLPSINMHIHTSTCCTYFFIQTNKQTNNILGFDFNEFLISLTFEFQPGLGPARIQGQAGRTMLNGILAFSILGFHLLSRLHPPYCLTLLKQSEESAPTSTHSLQYIAILY